MVGYAFRVKVPSVPNWSLVRLRAIKVDLKESPMTLAKSSMERRFNPLVIYKIDIINEKINGKLDYRFCLPTESMHHLFGGNSS